MPVTGQGVTKHIQRKSEASFSDDNTPRRNRGSRAWARSYGSAWPAYAGSNRGRPSRLVSQRTGSGPGPQGSLFPHSRCIPTPIPTEFPHIDVIEGQQAAHDVHLCDVGRGSGRRPILPIPRSWELRPGLRGRYWDLGRRRVPRRDAARDGRCARRRFRRRNTSARPRASGGLPEDSGWSISVVPKEWDPLVLCAARRAAIQTSG